MIARALVLPACPLEAPPTSTVKVSAPPAGEQVDPVRAVGIRPTTKGSLKPIPGIHVEDRVDGNWDFLTFCEVMKVTYKPWVPEVVAEVLEVQSEPSCVLMPSALKIFATSVVVSPH